MDKINKIKTSLSDKWENVDEKLGDYKQGQEDTFNRVEDLEKTSGTIEYREEYEGIKYLIIHQVPKGYYVKGNDAESKRIFKNDNSYFLKSEDANEHAILSIEGYLGDYDDEKKFSNKTSGLNSVFSAVDDATDVWRSVREYMLSRIKERYDTKQEMVDDINSKFKSVVQTIQTQYDSWFENELQANPSVYNIEILGEDKDVVDESQMGLNEDDNDIINENEMGDNNDELNLDDDGDDSGESHKF